MSIFAHKDEQICSSLWVKMPVLLGRNAQSLGEPWAKSMMTLHIIAYTFYHDIYKCLSVACLH